MADTSEGLQTFHTDYLNMQALLNAARLIDSRDLDSSSDNSSRLGGSQRLEIDTSDCSAEGTGVESLSPSTSHDEAVISGEESVIFFRSWEGRLLSEDNCFLYQGDEKSAASFTLRMNGQTPEAFARAALHSDKPGCEAMQKAMPEAKIVPFMVDFWADRMAHYRQAFSSKDAARTAFSHFLEVLEVLIGRVKKGKHLTPDGLVALSRRQVTFGPPEHVTTMQVVPVLLPGKRVMYQERNVRFCHASCYHFARGFATDSMERFLKGMQDNDLRMLLTTATIAADRWEVP